MIFGNPVRGRIGAPGKPDPSSGFVVTSPFGPRGDGFHDGLDIDNGGAPGDPILAMADGEVYQSFTDSASGGANIIRIDHGGGWTTGYAHMSVRRASVGQHVSEGQQIGDLGETGWATGPHLHMDTSYNNERRDPWPLLRQNNEEAEEDVEILGTYERNVYGQRLKAKGTANLHTEPAADSPILQDYAEGTGWPGHLVVSAEGAEWYTATLYVNSRGYCLGYIHAKNVERDWAGESEGWLNGAKPFAALAKLSAGQPIRHSPNLTNANIAMELETPFTAEVAAVVQGDEYNGSKEWLAYPLNGGGWRTFARGQALEVTPIDYEDALPDPAPIPPDPCVGYAYNADNANRRTFLIALMAVAVMALIVLVLLAGGLL